MWKDAAKLGSNEAHYELGRSYINGDGVVQDRARALEHWQLSAMKGHAHSRHDLGVLDSNKGNYSD